MAFNKNELILDRIRRITAHDLSTNGILYTMSSIEDPSLNCTAEGEDVTDALGSVITTLYRAKNAELTGTNSLIHLGLAAAQYGAKKIEGTAAAKITDVTYDILKVENGSTVKTSKVPKDNTAIKYVYAFVDNDIATAYEVGSTASATKAVVAADGTVTPPTGFTGKLFVEYEYEVENAVSITNKTEEFPEACGLVVYAIFRDKCNENIVYSGKIIIPKAKLNPESIELALTSTGKHAFSYKIMKDYCSEDAELFTVIIAGSDYDASGTTPYVTLNKGAASLVVGGTETLTVAKYPADATVTWTSTNTSVATVANGVVTGEGAGQAVIVATITSGGQTYTALCTVTVAAA